MDEPTLRQGNISLVLEDYNDLFSDFDPRGYDQRALSQDFLEECQRAIRDRKESELELNLLVPKHLRNADDESRIRHRLKQHFDKHYREKRRQLRLARVRGVRFFASGIVFMLAAAYLYRFEEYGFGYQILLVMLEPAGWFSFWTGLDQLFFGSKELQADVEYLGKMSRLQVSFKDYTYGINAL